MLLGLCQQHSYTFYKYFSLIHFFFTYKDMSVTESMDLLITPRDEHGITSMLVMIISQFTVFVISK